MLNLSNIIHQNIEDPGLVCSKIDNTKIGFKLHLPIKLACLNNNFRHCSAMVDSGSDIDLIQLSYFYRLFPDIKEKDLKNHLDSTSLRLTSYTNHSIRIIGVAKVKMSFDRFHPTENIREINLFVVENKVQTRTPFILSLGTLGRFDINMRFKELEGLSVPNLYKHTKIGEYIIPSYYFNEIQLSFCHGYVENLKAGESKHVMFVISPVSPLVESDSCMISQDTIPYFEMKNIRIAPSTSILKEKQGEIIGYAQVTNSGKTPFSGVIKATADLIDKSYEIKQIDANTIENVANMKLNLISECYYPSENENPYKIIKIHKEISENKLKPYLIPKEVFSLDLVFPQSHLDKSNTEALNNDVDDLSKSLTEERHHVNETFHHINKDEIVKYYDPKTSIQMGFQSDLPDITTKDMEPVGTGIPHSLIQTPQDLIREKDYEKDVWPFVQDIFLKKYPDIISRHALDHGSLSTTLGFYVIRTKDNITLPRYRKLYYLDPEASSQMRDTLEFLCRTKVISKATCAGGDIPEFASPSFLVRKSSSQSPSRLVVDYRLLNEVLALEPITLSNFDIILNELRDATMYTSLDLKAAFNSILIHPDSRKYTLFSSQFGSYFFNSLATGMAVSPNCLARFCDRMINYLPQRDNKGNVMYDENNYPIMVPSKLDNCQVFYDDLILYTQPEQTYKETQIKHFKLVEEVAKRLSFHHAKIELNKAHFAKALINFLGWLISNNFLQPDPKRIEKIQETPFPKTVTGMRAYGGIINFLRLVLGFTTLRHMHKLTPLTSKTLQDTIKTNDKQIDTIKRTNAKTLDTIATDEQKQAFYDLNKSLTSSPLYSKICLPGTSKILMTDSGSEQNAAFSCVLAQLVPSKRPKPFVPFYLFMEDDTHKIIYDLKLPVRPIKNKSAIMTDKEYLTSLHASDPPEFLYLKSPTLGYEDQVDNSFGISLQSMLTAQNCKVKYKTICIAAAAAIRKQLAYFQILQNDFGNNKTLMEEYLNLIQRGILKIDKKLYIIRAVANVLYRMFIIINSTDDFKDKQITFNQKESSPPFYFLLYKREGKFIIKPTILEKHTEYQMGKHRGSFEVILYYSKTIPKQMQQLKIVDLELYALLSSLKACNRLIGRDELLILIDNKCLYYAFHSTTLNSSTKIVGWGKMLVQQYPSLKLGFISSKNNPSDWLTRNYGIDKAELTKIKLPTYIDHLLDDYIPQDRVFTIKEWIEWVAQNEQFIKFEPKVNTIKSIENCIDRFNMEQETEISENLNATFANTTNIETTDSIHEPPNTNSKLHIIEEEEFLNHDAIYKINKLNIQKTVYSTKFAKSNSQAIFNPIRALENILTHQHIIDKQQAELNDIYTQCSLTPSNIIQIDDSKYSLDHGLLYKHAEIPQLYIPTSLLSSFISMAHITSNHSGSKKMLSSLSTYYHPKLRAKCELFASICMACILVNHPTKVQKLGFFPLDADPGQCLHLDVIESLGKASGDNHILAVKDPISNFALLLPLRSKTSEEFIRVFNASIYPLFHPLAIFCDNGTIFTAQTSLETLAIMGTKTIYSTAYSGYSHGGIEVYVGYFKKIMKKILTIQPNLNWTAIPALISHIHNVSKNIKTNYSPAEVLFGTKNHLSKSYLDTTDLPDIHPLIKNQTNTIQSKHTKMQNILTQVTFNNIEERDKRLEYANKNKILKDFSLGDISFIRDRSIPLGSTKPLRTYFLKDPFIIIQVKPATLVLRRISDNYVFSRTKNDVKRYVKFAEEFKDLPQAVLNICEQDPPNLTQKDIENLLTLGITDFEEFGHSPVNENNETADLIADIDLPPIEPVQTKDTYIQEILEEDEDFDNIGVNTRSQVKKRAGEKLNVTFDLPSFSDTN